MALNGAQLQETDMALVNPNTQGGVGPTSGAMKHDVTRRGPDGTEVVTVTAETGDKAAMMAFKAGTIVVGVVPHDDVEQVIEQSRPLTLMGVSDGAKAADVKAQNDMQREVAPGNAEQLAKATEVASAGTTNAIGIEGATGPKGRAATDLPEASPLQLDEQPTSADVTKAPK